jgi:hypothetical protein
MKCPAGTADLGEAPLVAPERANCGCMSKVVFR